MNRSKVVALVALGLLALQAMLHACELKNPPRCTGHEPYPDPCYSMIHPEAGEAGGDGSR